MQTKNIILLTNGYPYEKGEQFLETEILYLSKKFSKIYIYPISWNGVKRDLPQNVEVIKFHRGSGFSVKKLLIKRLRVVFNLFRTEFLSSKRRRMYKGKFKHYFDSFMGILNDAESFHNHLKLRYSQDILIYSYWFGPWGSIMSCINDISKGKIDFITRVHGYDYDVNQRNEGFIPFRAYQMKRVEGIFPVSNYAFNAIKKEYSTFKNIKTYRLGVEDRGDNPWQYNNNTLRIVSCSSLIPLKRVHLIIELLQAIKIEIQWIHFGDGELVQEIKERAKSLPENVSYEFKGHVSNKEIIDFYQNNSVDFFINVSELEGIPVSLMEAISFGIPVMGCNICGVPEIVTNETGILVEKDFDIRTTAIQIEKFLSMKYEKMQDFRVQVKEYWRKHFNAELNYKHFINDNLLSQ